MSAGPQRPSIHHVQIAMPPGSEEDARRFYGDLLGFAEIEKPANLKARGGVWFRTGNLELHLGVEQDFHPARKAHVAFQVANLEGYRHRLTDAGYPVVEDEPLEGYTRFYTSDPFGNRLELMESQHIDRGPRQRRSPGRDSGRVQLTLGDAAAGAHFLRSPAQRPAGLAPPWRLIAGQFLERAHLLLGQLDLGAYHSTVSSYIMVSCARCAITAPEQ